MQAGLVERERRLGPYRVAGRVEDGQGRADFTFAYRPPQRFRAEVGPPLARTLAFDGHTLFQREGAGAPLQQVSLEGRPRAEVAAQLHQLVRLFVCEGFRPPLFEPRTTRAWRTSHPRAPQAVALTTRAQVPGEGAVTVTYTLRWPALDFLHKRLEGPAGTSEVRVEEETCAGGRCVPRRWTQWSGEARVATVHLSEVALGEALPETAFRLTP